MQHPGKIVRRLNRIGFQAEGFLIFADRLIGLAFPFAGDAQIVVERGIIWSQAEGFLVFADGRVNLAFFVEGGGLGVGAQGRFERIFFMLTLLMYARSAETIPTTKARMFYALALLFFALGLMSKPMLMTVPFVLLLLDWWPLGRVAGCKLKVEGSPVPSRQPSNLKLLIFEKWPFFLLSAGSCVATFLAQREVVQSAVPFADRFGNAATACATYLGQMVWPVKLAAFYPYPERIPVWPAAGAGAWLIAITGLVVLAARKFPYLPVGWFWYLGMLVPVIGLVQVGDQSHARRERGVTNASTKAFEGCFR